MDPKKYWVGTWATSPAPSVAAESFNNHTLFGGQDLANPTALASFGPTNHHHLIPLFHVEFGARRAVFEFLLLDRRRHGYRTSGASEMIFMNRFSRSSRATGPKMRVPTGLFSESFRKTVNGELKTTVVSTSILHNTIYTLNFSSAKPKGPSEFRWKFQSPEP